VGGENAWASAAAFSPDGRFLAWGDSEGAVRLVDPGGGTEARSFVAHQGEVNALAFSPDGRLLASADEAVRVWDVATGRLIRRLSAGRPRSLAFRPDGRLLVAACRRGAVMGWDAATGRALFVLDAHSEEVNALAFTPDGRRLVTGAGEVRAWDLAALLARRTRPAAEE
jgi:WD40 repeat protein